MEKPVRRKLEIWGLSNKRSRRRSKTRKKGKRKESPGRRPKERNPRKAAKIRRKLTSPSA